MPRTVGDEDVTTPSSDHPSIEQRGEHTVECTSLFECTNPQVKGEHEEEDGDGLVVIGTSDGSRNVA